MKTIRWTLPLLLSACSMAPQNPIPAAMPVPAAWPEGDVYRAVEPDAPQAGIGFRDIFTDPRLQSLITQALETNRDLRIAAANVMAARAQLRIQRAEQFPQIDAAGGADYTHGNHQGSASYSAQLSITAFELDLFGRLASLSAAEQNRYLASEAGARTTRLALVGDLADAWIAHAADASLLKIAQDTVASAEHTVSLTRARLSGGIAPRSDLRQADQILGNAQADVARQRTALAQDANAIQLLLGRPVDPTLLPGAIEQTADAIRDLPAGLDSRILLRRPDVIEAEYLLRAANAEIGAARAAMFPRISLTGLMGFASNALSALFTNGAFGYSGAADASYPIFRASAGKAGLDQSKAQRDGALAGYERAIQSAFRDVADGLARRGTIEDELAAVRRQADAADDAYTLADARYREGVDMFLSSLIAQRTAYSSRQLLVSLQREAASNRIALFRALGGDTKWQ